MEEWRTIPDWPKYQASSLGRIRRAIANQGTFAGRLLKSWVNNNGYSVTRLYDRDVEKTLFVHALVCAAFHGPRPSPKMTVAHLNGVRSDNRAENLQWKTQADNHADKVRHGTLMRGEGHPSAKLSHMDVIDIHVRLNSGERQCDLAKEYSVARSTIQDIASGAKWKHITSIWRVT